MDASALCAPGVKYNYQYFVDREKSASWTISCELRGLFGFCSFHFSYADYRGVSIGACS